MPSAVVGSIVQAVKSMPMPTTSAGSTPDSTMTAGTARWNVRDVVVGILERPVGAQADVVVGRRQVTRR